MNDYQNLLELHEAHKKQVEILVEREVNRRVRDAHREMEDKKIFPSAVRQFIGYACLGVLTACVYTWTVIALIKLLKG